MPFPPTPPQLYQLWPPLLLYLHLLDPMLIQSGPPTHHLYSILCLSQTLLLISISKQTNTYYGLMAVPRTTTPGRPPLIGLLVVAMHFSVPPPLNPLPLSNTVACGSAHHLPTPIMWQNTMVCCGAYTVPILLEFATLSFLVTHNSSATNFKAQPESIAPVYKGCMTVSNRSSLP